MALKCRSIVVLTVLMGAGLLAADEKTEEPKKSGFFGTLTVGGYYTSGESSQLDQDDDNRRIDRLTKNEKSTSKGGPGALASLGYRFAKTGTEISLGSTIENGGALTLEALQPFAKIGEMKWSLQAGSGKTWKDPYVTGRDREETDEDSFGFGYKWEKIMKTGALVGFQTRSIDIEEDAIGNRYADLKRDGRLDTFQAGYEFKVNEGNQLTPLVGFSRAEADGESNDYDGYSLGLKHVLATEKFSLESAVTFGGSQYQKRHPLFDRTREDKEYAFLSTLTWFQPFGFKNYHVILSAGYNRTESNIGFFEQSRYLTLLGIGYSF